MTDLELKILCVIQEAGNQPAEGQAAVERVIGNRTRLHYNSNGTTVGTIEGHDQFSWVTHAFAGGHYVTVARDGAQTAERVTALLAQAKAHTASWGVAAAIVARVEAGAFRGPLYDRLTDLTVLYDNLTIAQPDWARTARKIVQIGSSHLLRGSGARLQGRHSSRHDRIASRHSCGAGGLTVLHWIFHALFVLFVAALICALGYGCDRIYLDDMVQRGIVARLSSERSADIASASAHATACAADVSAAVKAGVAIGRISAPRHRAAGSPQPMVTAGQITEAIR